MDERYPGKLNFSLIAYLYFNQPLISRRKGHSNHVRVPLVIHQLPAKFHKALD